MQAQWPKTDRRIHLIFGTLSFTVADNDALELIATRNLEDGDGPDAIVRRLIPFHRRIVRAAACLAKQAPFAGS